MHSQNQPSLAVTLLAQVLDEQSPGVVVVAAALNYPNSGSSRKGGCNKWCAGLGARPGSSSSLLCVGGVVLAFKNATNFWCSACAALTI